MSQNKKEIEKELLGIKFPRFDVSPMKRHPLGDEIDKRGEKEFAELGISSFWDPDMSDSVYICFPYVSDPQLLYYLVILTTLAFKVDDFLEREQNSKGIDNWRKYFLEKTCPGNNEAEIGYLLLIEEGRKCLTEEQLDVINDTLIKGYSCAPTVHKVLNGLKLTNEEYMRVRLLDINTYCVLYVFAFGLGITVEQIDNNKVCQEIMIEVIKDIIIANDLCSLRKEVFEGMFKWNYLYIKMQNNNVSAQKGVEMLMNEMDVTKQNVLTLASKLKATTKEKSMHDFADAMENLIDGNRYWSWMCQRYNGIHLYQ